MTAPESLGEKKYRKLLFKIRLFRGKKSVRTKNSLLIKLFDFFYETFTNAFLKPYCICVHKLKNI